MKKSLVTLFYLTLAGVLFSGYLSSVKLFTKTCAFNESCPYFLGYPACFFGFGMFLTMFVVTALGLWRKIGERKVFVTDAIIGFLGILFAGNFAIDEFATSRATSVLGFSTCVYGLIFYIIIFVLSLVALRRKSEA